LPVIVTMREITGSPWLTHGIGGAGIGAQNADIDRALAARHFLAREQLDQLLLAAAGIQDWYRNHFKARVFSKVRATASGLHRRDGLGLVVLDADQDFFRLHQVRHDFDARHDFGCAFAHQQVVGGDPGFALGAVQDQGLDLLLAGIEFDVGGEHRAAQADDAGIAQQGAHRIGVGSRVV
jgi:hypothetical protein